MKKIAYLTGTRADFGKLKSLIQITSESNNFEVHIFVTGMHMSKRYGSTYDEILKCKFKNVFMFKNQLDTDPMDIVLSKTIKGFSKYINSIRPDMIVIHGDRVESLAGAIVGVLNNILTSHIEGGEVSGTVDELIRHAVSKMCHIHFVSNQNAKKRLIQMGEDGDSVFIIGSPDIDIMLSDKLPELDTVKKRYGIKFDRYSIMIFHPVVTESEHTEKQIKDLVNVVLKSGRKFVVVYPNNDRGSDKIFSEYKRFKGNPKIKLFPSLRFEYFLVLLKNADFIIGNSSSGIREAPYYGIPTINIGTRQLNRSQNKNLINCGYNEIEIEIAINKALNTELSKKIEHYGNGNADKLFMEKLGSDKIWKINKQKQFRDII
jgi:UDP-N-acetylglucosamine 2-epimerase (hydrolysing)